MATPFTLPYLPPPLALLTAQQEPLKIYIYLYHICHIHVFLKLRNYLIQQMQFEDISNQITIALIINFGNFNILIMLLIILYNNTLFISG